ncbi:MAG: hypothetical protein ABJO27_07345 [Pseudoruegeria sp.]
MENPKPGYADYNVQLNMSSDGKVTLLEIWEKNGEMCRPNGPALTERSDITGNVLLEIWCCSGAEHRSDGPAVTEFQDDKTPMPLRCLWMWYGKKHRRGGPALKEWDESGNVVREEWWIDGKRL